MKLDKVQAFNYFANSLHLFGKHYIDLVTRFGRHIIVPEASQSIHKVSLELAHFGELERQKMLMNLFEGKDAIAQKLSKKMSVPFKNSLNSFKDLVNDVFEF